jgi:hypothetical protein
MKGYYLALVDENDQIVAGLPIFAVKSWLIGTRLVSIPYATLCDPLVDDPVQMEQLLQAVTLLANNVGTKRIEIRTFMSPELFADGKFGRQSYYKHHYLPLVAEPEELKKSFHRSCVRQRISRALNSEVEVRIGESKSDLAVFYKLHIITRQRLGLPPQPCRFFELLWDTFFPSGHLTLLLAFHGNKELASLVLFKFRNRVSAEFAASNETSFRLSPSHLLFWEAIKMACLEGYEVFDFGRTSAQNNDLMEFKRRWGTKMMDLPQFVYPKSKGDSISPEDKISYRILQAVCKRAPDSLLPYIGDFIYHHLG